MGMPLTSDLRAAARSLRASPTVTLSAILCLGLGLGVTAAISSAIDRALLQAPPFRDPSSLVTIYRTTPQFNTGPFSAPNYVDLARQSHKFSAVAALSFGTALLTQQSTATQVSSLAVTGNLFPMLGAHAELGRLLTPLDDQRNQNLVVVLSDDLWRERFGADKSIVNRTILLDGRQVTVVGITPRDFRLPRGGSVLQPQVWIPLRFTDQQLQQRGSNFLPVMGRLAPGATIASGQRELDNLFNGIVNIYPDLKGEGIRVVPLMADATAALRTPLLLLFGAVIMVLLIAATDVAALLLARSVYRRRDTAIRTALGGGRWPVMRPVIAESALLALGGCVFGLALAWVGVRAIATLASQRLPQLAGLSVDARVILFALAIAFLVAIVCGAAPAWRATSVDPQEALRGGGTGRAQHRVLGALVIGEVALSLMLLVGAGLVLRGFAKLVSAPPGFDADRILTMNVTVSPAAHPGSEGVIKQFLEPALAAVQQVPGVAAASAIQVLPYQNWGWNSNTRYEGQVVDERTQLPLTEMRVISPEFFDVTQQRLIAGRRLRASDDDRAESPAVVVVNQALVKRDFKDKDPIGKRFYTGDSTFGTIVGVVSDIRNVGPYRDPAPEMYWTWRQQDPGLSSFPVMIRVTAGDPEHVTSAVTRAIQHVDPLAAISQVRPMNDVISASVGQPRFYLILLATFAAVAIVLAVAGLYGVMSYSVAQRTRELGIRNALGSSGPQTVGLVARQGLTLVGIGLLLGLAGAAALTRLLTGFLYGVSALDARTWVAASILLLLAGLIATLIPSFRATRVNPMIAMRGE
jgi:predicted permease